MGKVNGIDEVRDALGAMAQAMSQEVRDAVFIGAKQVEGEAKRLILSASPGREVMRYHNGRAGVLHIAAAAGQAPNNDTGKLAASIQTEMSADYATATVGVGAEYASDLEYGTEDMRPRPFMAPALDAYRDRIIESINAAIRRAARQW
jgi:HK97 gp10 family phage protein